MKKDRQQKITIKKLTIARISTDAMKHVEGGSTVLTSQQWEEGGVMLPFCYNEK
ncbi:class I lanthipeptide [uncultured Aquimarina sp.]|uniref:class I lanthipeptide n=1 Tax=uncultured Aquimarina sp. TaxID=575652 RepID=UPI002602ADF2|nr:class I lanthipeptide [uncultured Aquimarina sp.]